MFEVKPEFDHIPYRDHNRTNIVMLPPALVFARPCVFLDEHETEPNRRYKLFTSSRPQLPDSGADGLQIRFILSDAKLYSF